MSLSNTTAQVGPYTIVSFPATLAVSFPAALGTDLLVQSIGTILAPNDPPVTLTYNSDYTTTGFGFNSSNAMLTGSVVCVGTGSHLVAVGERIVITLNTPATQETGFGATGLLTVPMIERAFDKLTNITKTISEGLKRTLRVPTSTTSLNEIDTSPFKSMVLGFDANMQPTPYAPTPGAAMPVATSSTVGTVKPDNSTTIVSASGVLSAPSGTRIVSVAALKLEDYSEFPDNTPIELLGYYAAGDGGGGKLYVDKADTTTADNGVTVFVANDGTRIKSVNQYATTAEQAGAKGDGSTDDTVALRAALAACNTVILSGRTYKTTGNIVVGTGKRIIGNGSTIYQTVLPAVGSVPNSATDYDCLIINGSNVYVENLILRGPSGNSPAFCAAAQGMKGFSIQPPSGTISSIEINNIEIKECQSNGLQIWNGVSDISATHINVHDCGNEGVLCALLSDGNFRFKDLIVYNVKSWGFDTNCGEVLVDGFSFWNCGDNALVGDCGGFTWSSADSANTRESVKLCNGRMYAIIGDAVNMTVPSTLNAIGFIVDNIVIGKTSETNISHNAVFVSKSASNAGLLLDSRISNITSINHCFSFQNCKNVTVDNCSIVNYYTQPVTDIRGINVDLGATPSGKFTVSNCIVKNWYIGIRWQSFAYGASINNWAEDSTVDGIDVWTILDHFISIGDDGSGNPSGNVVFNDASKCFVYQQGKGVFTTTRETALISYADNAAAIAAGLATGDHYRLGDTIGIVH